MSRKQGKLILQSWFEEFDRKEDINEIMYYGSGYGAHAESYQHETIQQEVNKPSGKEQFVVKYFIHMDLYAAWLVEHGNIRKRYELYKRDLEDMENDIYNNYKSALISKDERVFFFRGKEGFRLFVESNLSALQTV